MAVNLKMPNKKTTIIVSTIIAILAIIAVTATVVFLKDRGSTEAAELNNGQASREEVTTTQDTPSEQTAQTQTAENVGVQNLEGEEAEGTAEGTTTTEDATGAGATDASTTTTTTTAGGTATGTTTRTDTIQEATISRTEEVQIPERQISEGHYVGWTPMQIDAKMASANIVAERADLTINKIAKTKNSENLVTRGEVITYEISVKNNSEKELTGIEIKDRIPAMTEYKKDSVDNNGEEILNGKTVAGLKWNIDLKAGEEKVVSFQVTVSDGATGKITNVAVVNGETTEPVETAVITATKTATIEGKEEGQLAKVGDKITYTITVANTGDIAGKANVKDESLAKLVEDGILKIDEASKEVANKVIEGTLVDVPANGEGKISFTVIVEKINGAIKNVATVGEEETEKTVDTVNITAEKSNTDADNKVKPGDTVVYTIKLSNSGNAEGTTTVTDKLPAGVIYQSSSDNGVYNNGTVIWENVNVPLGTNSKELTVTVTIDKTAEGKIENTAIVENETQHDEGLDLVKITANKSSDITTRVKVGQEVTYTITAVNNGTTVGDAVITDQIPDSLEYKEATLTAAGEDTISVENGLVTWNVKDLESGEGNARTLTIKATIKDFEGTITTITNEVKVDGEKTSETTIEAGKPVITSEKESSIESCTKGQTTGTIVHENDQIKYTIKVSNTGGTSGKVTVEDTIKEGLTYVQGTAKATVDNVAVSGVTVNNEKVSLTDYTLAAGKTIVIEFTAKVNSLPEGVYSKTIETNVAVVNGENVPDDGGYEVQKPQVESSKVVDKAKAEYNEELTYTITVKNISTIVADVNVSDLIPEGTEYMPNSITVNGEPVADANNYIDGKVVYTGSFTKQNETLTITFKVKVTEKTIGKVITNIANINGEEKQATTKVIKTVTVGTESTKVTPIDLVLVLDVSRSMNNNSRLSSLQSSAKTLVNKVFADETTSTISVITYSSEVKSVNTYTYAQRNNLTKAIDSLTANGGTNIYSALEQANTTVSGLGTEREKVVVFLTDGAPTIPSNLYIDGVHTESNSGSGYTNNIKNPIVEKANSLKALSGVKKVYSIGLGVNSLSDSTISYAEECTDVLDVNKDIAFDTENHTFTVTLTNSTNTEVTLEQVDVSFSDINKLLTAENGEIRRRDSKDARWENVTIAANGSVTLTGTYEPSYDRKENERTPLLASIDTGYEGVCTTEGHDEQFNGSALFTETKAKSGKQYHCITTQDYAKYLLSKISSDGTSMNVDIVSTAFDKILHDISTTSETYTLEEGNVIDIPETHTIISDVTVTIGESSNTYTLDQLKSGVDGLVYEEGVGFKWTITGDTLLTNKLSLEYKIEG